ncbi:Hypothetical predicted protein [Paramuricea clavata]|uniref:Endonuclease/exonuclease/phosphatase domain-containing protein n=1 Tax=Paramuricea clavata TaxID=317549 RepID=A0A7D9DNJ7_PARCT|nr:Hypothetical predicted protein [Paramuricea clavata]
MNEVDLAGITETWLNSIILDSCVNIQGYNLVRNDRTEKRGGGVCVFVKSSIPFVTLPNLGCPNHECLWVKLRPYRLPREISCIIVCVLYNPPLADNNELYEYIIVSLDKILLQYPGAGVIVMGDFNQFDTKRLCRNSSLKQIVKKPTRGIATLDLILTNIKRWYKDPDILPAIGQSDHMSIMLYPLENPVVPTQLPKFGIMDTIHSTLDQRQFGSLKGYSTVDALISMFHCWFSDTDGNGETVDVFDEYGRASGARLNRTKSKGLWLGSHLVRVLKEFSVDLSQPQQSKFYYARRLQNCVSPVQTRSEVHWNRRLGPGVIWKDIWKEIAHSMNDPVLRDFDWRTVNRILPVNSRMHQWNSRLPPRCARSGAQVETLEHNFINGQIFRLLLKISVENTGRGNPGGAAGDALAAPGGGAAASGGDATRGSGPASAGGARRGSDASRGGRGDSRGTGGANRNGDAGRIADDANRGGADARRDHCMKSDVFRGIHMSTRVRRKRILHQYSDVEY